MQEPVYIVEARQHKGENLIPNEVRRVIGVFSNQIRARIWIEEQGPTFFGDRFPKNVFWAICKTDVDDFENCPTLLGFYNKNGGKIL